MIQIAMIPIAAWAIVLAGAQAPAPTANAAVFNGGSITFADLDRYLAHRYGRDTVGKDAVDYLIRDRVLDREIEKRGIVVDASSFGTALRAMEEQLLAAEKHSLDDELAQKGMDRATFEAMFRKHLACDKLVRADLGLKEKDQVQPDQQELWLADRVKAAKVERDGLDRDTFATVDTTPIKSEDVGRTLRLKLGRNELREALKAIVGMRLVDMKAKEQGVEAGPDDVEAAIQRRRERFIANNPMAGVGFEEFLKAKGVTIDDLRLDGGVRGEALLWKIGMKLYPDEEVDRQAANRRDHWEGLFGESRRVSWLLLYASHAPGFPVSKTFAEADEELKQMAARATSAEEFGRLASVYSNHATTGKRKGDLGWLHRNEGGFDAALLAAVFAPDVKFGKPIGPFHTDQGSALALVLESKPGPGAAAMRPLIRTALIADMYQKLRDEAKITTYLDAKADPKPQK